MLFKSCPALNLVNCSAQAMSSICSCRKLLISPRLTYRWLVSTANGCCNFYRFSHNPLYVNWLLYFILNHWTTFQVRSTSSPAAGGSVRTSTTARPSATWSATRCPWRKTASRWSSRNGFRLGSITEYKLHLWGWDDWKSRTSVFLLTEDILNWVPFWYNSTKGAF